MKKLIVAITILLITVTAYATITGGYTKIKDVTGEQYHTGRNQNNTPINVRDTDYPWNTKHFDYSIWSNEAQCLGISVGVKKPGATLELEYSITETEVKRQNLTIVCRLVEQGDSQRVLDEYVEEKTGPPFSVKWRTTLPETTPMNYSFGVVVYDSIGRIIDGSVHRITVPSQELVAVMHVDPPTITTEKKAFLVIENLGKTSLTYGNPYLFQKHVNDSWVIVPSNSFWTMPLNILFPKGTHRNNMNIQDWDTGRYRVVKELKAEGTDLEETLYAEFTVTRPPEPTDQIPEYGYRHTYALATSSLESPDRAMLMLDNLGARAIYLDGTYTLDVKEGGEWTPIYVNTTKSLTTIRRGESTHIKFGTPNMPDGDYRLTLTLGIEGTTAKDILRVTFDIP